MILERQERDLLKQQEHVLVVLKRQEHVSVCLKRQEPPALLAPDFF